MWFFEQQTLQNCLKFDKLFRTWQICQISITSPMCWSSVVEERWHLLSTRQKKWLIWKWFNLLHVAHCYKDIIPNTEKQSIAYEKVTIILRSFAKLLICKYSARSSVVLHVWNSKNSTRLDKLSKTYLCTDNERRFSIQIHLRGQEIEVNLSRLLMEKTDKYICKCMDFLKSGVSN